MDKKIQTINQRKKTELIGSGWSQIIGPLVPYEVNIKNQEIGLKYYEDLLGYRPKIALVNEMVFSSSMIEIYKKVGYNTLIMDSNNFIHATNKKYDHKSIPNVITYKKDCINVIWSESIIFQKFQRYVFDEISYKDFLRYFIKKLKHQSYPIYSNDAEIFDFRPGRFKEEAQLTKNESEWKKINKLLEKITKDENINLISPSQIKNNNINRDVNLDLANPIIVKKQMKYNVNRWQLSGRNDVWLNTQCYKIFKQYKLNNITDEESWIKLCNLWTSDYRTHITNKKWKEIEIEIKNLTSKLSLVKNINYIEVGKKCDTKKFNFQCW